MIDFIFDEIDGNGLAFSSVSRTNVVLESGTPRMVPIFCSRTVRELSMLRKPKQRNILGSSKRKKPPAGPWRRKINDLHTKPQLTVPVRHRISEMEQAYFLELSRCPSVLHPAMSF